MDTKPTLISLVLIASASFVAGADPSPGQPTAYFDCLEKSGFGSFSGRIQTLLMHRDIEGTGDGTSGTAAITLDYLSPEFHGFTLGGQFISSTRLFESGSVPSAGYWLSNDDFNVLNEGYLAYDFDKLGWKDSSIKVGRQIVNYDFAPAYFIRQKAQSFESAILKLEPADGLCIDIGHLDRFSSWSSREGGVGAAPRADFVDVEQAAGVTYDTTGIQFISAVYDGCEPWSLAMYDFYGNDLYNVFGAKGSYKWELGSDAGALICRTHWANQQDVGRMDVDGLGSISSNVVELGVDWAREGLTLSAGAVVVNGDRFQIPFRTSFTIDTELLCYTDQFQGETNSGYLKGVYKTGNWLFYSMFVIDQHEDDTTCREIDGVVKYNFTDGFSTTVKAGYGDRKYSGDSGHSDAVDLRWFLAWTF